jgi:hypothetical protein
MLSYDLNVPHSLRLGNKKSNSSLLKIGHAGTLHALTVYHFYLRLPTLSSSPPVPSGGEDTGEGEQPEVLSTLTPALSRRREKEIWCIFPAVSAIRVDETATGDYSIKK